MTFMHPQIIRLNEIHSTNDYLEEILMEKQLPEGSMVVARHQTHGKGQGNNHWESEAGRNLTFSVVLYPDFILAEQQFLLTQLTSLSLCQLLDSLELPERAMIKWPNDIYLGNRKVAGMLIKNNICNNAISQTIAGIGLNVNQTVFTANAPIAVSLAMITGREYNLDDLLTMWHTAFEQGYDSIRKGDFAKLDQDYLGRLYLLNQTSDYSIQDERLRATITGIGKYGMLKLTAEDGRKFTCGLKEVVFER